MPLPLFHILCNILHCLLFNIFFNRARIPLPLFHISYYIYITLCVIQYIFQSSSNWDRASMPLPSGHCHFCISYLDISAAVLLHIKGRLFDNIEGGEFFLKSYKKIERWKKVKKVKVKNWDCHFCISSLDISAAAHQRQIVWQYWRMREFRFQK